MIPHIKAFSLGYSIHIRLSSQTCRRHLLYDERAVSNLRELAKNYPIGKPDVVCSSATRRRPAFTPSALFYPPDTYLLV